MRWIYRVALLAIVFAMLAPTVNFTSNSESGISVTDIEIPLIMAKDIIVKNNEDFVIHNERINTIQVYSKNGKYRYSIYCPASSATSPYHDQNKDMLYLEIPRKDSIHIIDGKEFQSYKDPYAETVEDYYEATYKYIARNNIEYQVESILGFDFITKETSNDIIVIPIFSFVSVFLKWLYRILFIIVISIIISYRTFNSKRKNHQIKITRKEFTSYYKYVIKKRFSTKHNKPTEKNIWK